MPSNYPPGMTSAQIPGFNVVERELTYTCPSCHTEIAKEHTVDPGSDNEIEDVCPNSECGQRIFQVFTADDLADDLEPYDPDR